ncbi:type II toxin-antitoxin system Phd/YefM family antitoxin [Plantibacter flavus]|uniref:type II toxin-antitoxin system Phd/YefM family antitoxin n=1 Tax=Plantibacter flavus TaxID=150123 RepID=UPI003F13F58E
MSTFNLSDARANFSDLIKQSRTEAVFVERRGHTEAVIISPEQYERMMEALEAAEDVRNFDAAMAEEGENVPWAQAKADLGWA